MSQQELAKKANITQAELSKLESGDGNPTIKTLSKIAQALDVHASKIINCKPKQNHKL